MPFATFHASIFAEISVASTVDATLGAFPLALTAGAFVFTVFALAGESSSGAVFALDVAGTFTDSF